MQTYNAALLLDYPEDPCQFISGYTPDDVSAEKLRLSLDAAIPANCIGYVAQLISPAATRAVRIDCMRMLSRFVSFSPNLDAIESQDTEAHPDLDLLAGQPAILPAAPNADDDCNADVRLVD